MQDSTSSSPATPARSTIQQTKKKFFQLLINLSLYKVPKEDVEAMVKMAYAGV